MMPWGPMLQSLVNQAIKRSEHLQKRIKELESWRFTSRSQAPLFLLRLLSSLNDQICNNLIEFDKSTFIPINYQGYAALHGEIKVLASMIANLYTYVSYIEAASTETNPPGIISAIERIANALLSKPKVLICPSLQCNYAYHNLLSKKNLRSEDTFAFLFDEKGFEGEEHFAVFLYPLALRDDVLCHALLMHEVGHLLDEVKTIVPQALEALEPKPYRYPAEELQSFFTEFVADIVAVCILGPAYLFAFIEFLTSLALLTDVGVFKTHPPLNFRIRNILDTIISYGQRFGAFVGSKYAENAERFLNGLGKHLSNENINADTRSSEVFDYLQPAIVLARNIIKDDVPATLRFSPTSRLFEKYIVWVEKGIPPAADQLDGEIKPLSLGEILNAAWLYQIMHLEFPYELPTCLLGSDYSIRLIDISRLIQLAIRQNEDLILYKQAGI